MMDMTSCVSLRELVAPRLMYRMVAGVPTAGEDSSLVSHFTGHKQGGEL